MTEETKHEKFVRMRDARLPKTIHSIGLLANLASHHYECSEDEAKALVTELQGAVDGIAEVFGVTLAAPQPGAISEGLPEADDSAADEAEPKTVKSMGRDVPAHLKPFPEDLTPEENAHLFRIGREHDRAINAIQDGKGQEAIQILLGLTTA